MKKKNEKAWRKAWMTWGTHVLGKKQGTGIASTPASNTPTPNASHSPYHPAYGLTDDTRIRALRIAETSGVKAAAKECRVATGTIYKWRSDYATSASNT